MCCCAKDSAGQEIYKVVVTAEEIKMVTGTMFDRNQSFLKVMQK